MPGPEDEQKPHINVDGFARAERYQSRQRGGGRGREVPPQPRDQHGPALQRQIQDLHSQAQEAHAQQQRTGLDAGFGIQVEFESFPDIELAFEKLARDGQGIELRNVRHDGQSTFATVFVPDGKLEHFEKLIQDYLDRKTDRRGRARDNRLLIDAIRQIRAASLRALWTDDPDTFPTREEGATWWEVWLPVRGDRQRVVARFTDLAERLEIRVAKGAVAFPERTVLLAQSSVEGLEQSIMILNMVAELRRPKETAEFFDALTPAEQSDWVHDALQRIAYVDDGPDIPYISLLDTGVNRGHPMLAPGLASEDQHTVEPAWGVDDQVGHGTRMAGLALLGDLSHVLSRNDPIELEHRLESVKLLPTSATADDDPLHHSYLTVQAVAAPEIAAPWRRRLFSMMTTARDNRDRGRPSAWSSALDRLACDADNEGQNPRLCVVAAGNADRDALPQFPGSNATDSIHDPGQAWNALTVGACTQLDRITEPDARDLAPVAQAGDLSPFSTTSATWPSHRPLKPDVVFEGGNAAQDSIGAVSMHSLSLLTTHHQPAERLLTTANATSAATALGARMAAELSAAYPNLWPETIRGLIVHSAEWTDSMRRMFLRGDPPKKKEYEYLVRHCGFGVPDLTRARWSASDSLTMLAQDTIQPFTQGSSNTPVLRDMVVHRLPWPADELTQLGAAEVEMRVTLSYFIEPNPSSRNVGSRYQYESHGLRFDVKRPHESDTEFRARISQAAQDETGTTPDPGVDSRWLLGTQNRHRGSLHADIWRGPAAELAARGMLAVYPSLGWWKTRTKLQRYESAARYALIVSIRAPALGVDLYTPIAEHVPTPTPVTV